MTVYFSHSHNRIIINGYTAYTQELDFILVVVDMHFPRASLGDGPLFSRESRNCQFGLKQYR